VSYKWVDKSPNVADNETPTDSYSLLNASIYYEQKLGKMRLTIGLKVRT